MLSPKIFPLVRQAVAIASLPIALSAVTPTATQAFQLTGLYVFSDSLSDVGNLSQVTNGQLPPPQLGYFNGRFSNGPVWVDYLAPQLGLTSTTQTNFSFPGATTGDRNTTVPNVLPGLQQQINSFTQAVPNADPGALYIVWAGANDYLGGGETNPVIPVTNLATAIQSLVGVGAKNILVPNLPDLGKVPLVRDRGTAVSEAATAVSIGHNTLLAQTLALLEDQLAPAGVNLIPLDVGALFDDAISNPASYGFTNVSDACLFPSPLLFDPLPAPITVCANPEQYVFWDSLHPSTTTHRFISDAAFAAIRSSAIPEPPATAGLLAVGVLMAGLTALKRKRKVTPTIAPSRATVRKLDA